MKSILPVKVSGKVDDKPFMQVAHTIDISQAGTRLGGFRVPVKIGDVVTLNYKHWRGNFQVAWVGQKGAAEGEAGLQAVAPGDCFWTEIANEVMAQYVDDYYRVPEPSKPATAAAATVSSSSSAGAAKPAMAPQPVSAEDALSARLRSVTARLVEIEQDMRSSEVDPAALQEFQEALEKLRGTCLAVQELIRVKTAGGEPRSVPMLLNAERVQAGIDLCIDLSQFARGINQDFEWPLVQKFLTVSEDLLLEAVFPESKKGGDENKPDGPAASPKKAS